MEPGPVAAASGDGRVPAAMVGLLPEITAHYEHEYDEGNRIVEGPRAARAAPHEGGDHPPPAVAPAGASDPRRRRRHRRPRRLARRAGPRGARHRPDRPACRAGARPRRTGLRITAELGDARDLPVGDSTFDAALLLGPLYHLTTRADRLQALSGGGARRAWRGVGVRGGDLSFCVVVRRAHLGHAVRSCLPRHRRAGPATTASTATPSAGPAGSRRPSSTGPTSCWTRRQPPVTTWSSSSAWRAWPAGSRSWRPCFDNPREPRSHPHRRPLHRNRVLPPRPLRPPPPRGPQPKCVSPEGDRRDRPPAEC